MKKLLSYEECQEALKSLDRQEEAYKAFLETSHSDEVIQISFYKCILTSIQIRREQIYNNPVFKKGLCKDFSK